jgi:crotonobetainyl-CoA:carnitine CoA-transferase CaiB-like acyl-CoA transferase
VQIDDDGSRRPRPRTGPLAGLRVADFCWMGVGSVATRMLADYGAEVIKIENRARLDTPRKLPIYKGVVRSYGEEDANPDPNKGGLFNNYCRSKLGVTIDMRQAAGRALADDLIRHSSIVTENFAPGVMERWGLTYDALRALVPDVIFARMSGYGHSGPHQGYRSYGPVIQAVSGLTFMSGLPDCEPSGLGLSYMDNQAAYYNSAALLAAILHRMVTGEGCEIDVSAVEAGVSLLGADLMDVTVNERSARRSGYPCGNRLEQPIAAPHGVYPCRGDDRWVAIAVFDEADWQRFVVALGSPAWAADPTFADQAARHAAQNELDARVAAWTRTLDRHEVMERLQSVGVAAAAVQDPRDLTDVDPQIAARGTFFELDHPVIGPALFEGSPMTLSRTDADLWRSAPLLGEDNDYVFGEILGLDSDRRAELAEAGVI